MEPQLPPCRDLQGRGGLAEHREGVASSAQSAEHQAGRSIFPDQVCGKGRNGAGSGVLLPLPCYGH